MVNFPSFGGDASCSPFHCLGRAPERPFLEAEWTTKDEGAVNTRCVGVSFNPKCLLQSNEPYERTPKRFILIKQQVLWRKIITGSSNVCYCAEAVTQIFFLSFETASVFPYHFCKFRCEIGFGPRPRKP